MEKKLNIVIADDSALIREGLAGLLERRGHKVMGYASDATELRELFSQGVAGDSQDNASALSADVLITDVRMPPKMADDGLKAAIDIRKQHPELGIIVLSQYISYTYALELFQSSERNGAYETAGGTGYLLKDRVSEVRDFLQSLDVIAHGGTVVDPAVTSALISPGRDDIARLSPREYEVLELMSRGKSNREIAQDLVLSSAAVAKHVSNIFMKLDLFPEEENRRVKAILKFLSYSAVERKSL